MVCSLFSGEVLCVLPPVTEVFLGESTFSFISQYRGPNINNRDHLVGQLAKESLLFPRLTVPGACVFTVASDPGKEQQKTRRRHDALSVMSRKQKTLKNADVAQTKNCGKVDGALQRIV